VTVGSSRSHTTRLPTDRGGAASVLPSGRSTIGIGRDNLVWAAVGGATRDHLELGTPYGGLCFTWTSDFHELLVTYGVTSPCDLMKKGGERRSASRLV